MKKIIAFVAVLAFAGTLTAAEHAIAPKKNSNIPGSFYSTGNAKGLTCVKNAAGKYVFRVDAKDGQKKLISGKRIAIGEKDTVKFRITISARKESRINTGMYIYCEVNRKTISLGAAYAGNLKVTPAQKVYEFTRVIPPNPKAKSAFERPSIGLFFFDFFKGADLDVEKIEYFITKAPQAKAPAIPDF